MVKEKLMRFSVSGIFVLILLISPITHSFSQGGVNPNGSVARVTATDCSINPNTNQNPFDMVGAPVVSGQNTSDTQSKVAVGDIDNDGIPDAVITSKWNSLIQVIATTNGQADGSNAGDYKARYNIAASDFPKGAKGSPCDISNLLFEHEVVIGDIGPNPDGIAEIFAIVSNRKGNPSSPPTCFFLVGFRYDKTESNPASRLKHLWTPVVLGSDRPGVVGITDFDGDGKAELYLRNRIYAAETGALLADGGGNWDSQIASSSVAVNMDSNTNPKIFSGDNKLELVCGNFIYAVPSLATRTLQSFTSVTDMNTTAPAALKYYVKLYNDPVEYGNDTHSSTAVADMDNDGSIDVVMSGSLISITGQTAIFYWNVAKNTISTYSALDAGYPNGWPWGTGRVNLYDSDADGFVNVNFIAGSQLFSLKTDDATHAVLNQKWVRVINDSRSGIVTVTCYDFDNDGKPEIVYRDSQELVVIDGATGASKLWSAPCQSHTFSEGPIIADVNDDGSTDICVPCYRSNSSTSFNINDPIQQQALGEIRLFFSSGNEWLPTRQVWNQPGYFAVNINDNLTIPFPQFDPNTVFGNAGTTCSNGLVGPQKPYNMFINQVPTLSANGCPIFPAPDLAFTGDTPNASGTDTNGDGVYTPAVVVIPPICGNSDISVYFNIINQGTLRISDNVPISFFNGDPTLPGAVRLYNTTLNVSNLDEDEKLTSPTYTFNGPGSVFQLYILIYNDGSVLPITQLVPSIKNCDAGNDLYNLQVGVTPFTVTIEKLSDNTKCSSSSPDAGALRIHIFKGATEVIDYSGYSFQWHNNATGTSPISGANQYSITNQPAGNYSVIVTDNAKGCQNPPVSEIIFLTTKPEPIINVNIDSHQTNCSPPNGQLTASIVGGNSGYSFKWRDSNSTDLGISGTTASNLTAGNYLVEVTIDGCPFNSQTIKLDGPVYPDVYASVLKNVEDCGNLNGGEIQAEVKTGLITQPSSDYIFDWYFYDDPTSTRGSILPPANGASGSPIRTQLASGFYQVDVKNIATNCSSIIDPVVEIQNSLVLPTVSIVPVKPLESCDPANPDGVFTASASGGTGFTFEWFKGDNTLLVNKVGSGATYSQAAGGGVYYTVKVTNSNNCTATDKKIVSENLIIPTLTLTKIDNEICDPSLTVPPLPPDSYSGSVTASGNAAGNPITNFTGYEFTWYTGSGVNALNEIPVADPTSPVLNGRDANYYTAVLMNQITKCSSLPQIIQVLDNTSLPALTTSATASTNCITGKENGTATVATPSGSFSYQWYDGNSVIPANIKIGETASTIGSTVPGTGLQGGLPYTVEVTDNSTGCKNTSTILIPDARENPTITVSKIDNLICDPAAAIPAISGYSGSVSVNSVTYQGVAYSGTVTYEFWNNATGTGIPGQSSASNTYGNRDNGTYSVRATIDDLGCTSVIQSVVVNDNTITPTIDSTIDPSTNCIAGQENGKATVTQVLLNGTVASIANFAFQWYDGNSVIPANIKVGETASTIGSTVPGSGLQGGLPSSSYTIEVTVKATGCKGNATLFIPDAKENPVVDVSVIKQNSFCLGGDGSLFASVTYKGNVINAPPASSLPANFIVTWAPGGSTGAILSNLQAGSYSATVTDSDTGCTSSADAETILNNFDIPVITTTILSEQKSCIITKPTGRLEGSATTTTSTLEYTWYKGIGITPGLEVIPKTIGNASGSVLQTPAGILSGTGTLSSDNYTFLVKNTETGCQNTKTIFLPEVLVTPTFTGTETDVTFCVPTNGQLDITLGTITEPSKFTIYYLNEINSAQTGDPNTVKTNATVSYVDDPSKLIYTGIVPSHKLAPGNYTVLIVDGITECESNPQTFSILDKTIKTVTASIDATPTFCSSLTGGELNLTVTEPPGSPPKLYTFEWYKGVPINANFNFLNNLNLPTFATSPIQTKEDLTGLGGNLDNTGVPTGLYTVVLIDNIGCGSVFIGNVPYVDAPVVNITPIHSTQCDPLASDAEIQVSVIGQAASTYSISLYTGFNPEIPANQVNGEDDFANDTFDNDGDGLIDTADDNVGTGTFSTTFSSTASGSVLLGDYVVSVFDVTAGCAIDKVLTLEIAPKLPVFTVSALSASTSCPDGSNNGDGEVFIELNTDPLDKINSPGYPVIAGYPAFSITNVGTAVGNTPPASGSVPQAVPEATSTQVTGLFQSKLYNITIVETNSGCSITRSVNVPLDPSIPTDMSVDFKGDSFCAPLTNGFARISSVTSTNPTNNFSFYDFSWYTNNNLTGPPVYSATGDDNGLGIGGEYLDRNKIPLNWNINPTTGLGNGDKTFYVRGQKRDSPGKGCYTPVVAVTIPDDHVAPQLKIKTFANTSCAPGINEGRLEVEASTASSDPVVSAGIYQFDWSGALVNGNITQGSPLTISNLSDDTYTINAVNTVNGCLAINTAEVSDAKFILSITDFSKLDQFLCSADGNIDVTKISLNRLNTTGETNQDYSGLPLTSEFSYQWYRAPAATPGAFSPPEISDDFATIISSKTLSAGTAAGEYSAMGAGTYYVIATRAVTNTLPAAGCSSLPFRVDILDKRAYPSVDILTQANTSCDPAFYDGKITSTASTLGYGATTLYDYIWTASPGAIENSPPGGTSLPFVNASNGLTNIIGPGDYALTVKNLSNGCESQAVATLLSNPLIEDILTFNKTNQLICNPDGSIEVTSITGGNAATDFTYEWFLNDPSGTALRDALNNPITTNILNTGTAASEFPLMGAGTYYIVATKVGNLPGSGCSTAPFRVDIEDRHSDPLLSFTQIANSSCDDLNPNGQITATASESSGLPGSYTFAWSYSNTLPAATTFSAANLNPNVAANAPEGNYTITVTNGDPVLLTGTGCSFTTTYDLILDRVISLPNQVKVSTVDPTDCKPSGQAEVTEISVGGAPPISGALIDPPSFSYTWVDDTNPSSPVTIPVLLRSVNILSPGNYHVVVQDNSTKCISGPVGFEIRNDKIVYPNLMISQTARQISCKPGLGTGELTATADGASSSDPNYSFEWFANLNLSGTSFANTSVVGNLEAGDYSVQVLDITTNCTSSDVYIISPDQLLQTPEISIGGQELTLCNALDGSVEVRVTNLLTSAIPSSDYPFPSYDFEALLFTGSSTSGSFISMPVNPTVNPADLLPGNFLSSGLDQGQYTVIVTDQNTGCFAVASEEVLDQRSNPVVSIQEDNPLINCDPARPNGQLSATVDDKIVGYTFDWYSGNIINLGDVPIVTNNKLIGQTEGDFIVRATDQLTGCFTDKVGIITNGQQPPFPVNPVVITDRTNCDPLPPNGGLMVSVDGQTLNYSFDWFNNDVVSLTPDYNGTTYLGLDIGPYTVVATDLITGCVSEPKTATIKDNRIYPDLVLTTTPAYCDDTGKPGIGTIILETKNATVLDSVVWTYVDEGTLLTDQTGVQAFGLYPGVYKATAFTSQLCSSEKEATVLTEILPYNGISRNTDTQNEYFVIDCITNFPNNNVKIYNRSGVLVYEGDGYNNGKTSPEIMFIGVGENGVYLQGRELPEGTYFYIIDKRDGSKPVAGYLELDR